MNKKRFYRGFTLIELMVVITIMITSGIVVLPKLTQFRNSSEVEEEVSRMLSAVKQAQSNAFVGAQCGDQFAPAFKSISWKFTANTQNYLVEPNCSQGTGVPMTNFNLKTRVTVSKVLFDSKTRSPDPLDITSLPSGGSGSRVEFSNISGAVKFIDGSGLDVLNYQRMIIILQSASAKSGLFIEKGGLLYTGAIKE